MGLPFGGIGTAVAGNTDNEKHQRRLVAIQEVTMNVYRLILILLLLAAVGCTAQTEPSAAPPPTTPAATEETNALQPANTPAPDTPEPEPTEPAVVSEPVSPVTVDLSQITPEAGGGGSLIVQPQPGIPNALPGLVVRAKNDLSRRLNVQESKISVVEAIAVDWSDGSIGCPEPGMGYIQVITPGYWIVLEVAGEKYFYHADQRDRLIHCPHERAILPVPTPAQPLVIQPKPGAPGMAEALAEKIVADLQKRLNVSREQIVVVQMEGVQWADSSLGCPQPGMNYLMVITPGYRVTLTAQGQEYVYHADQNERFVFCPDGQPPVSLDR
jgi:hypothetical protein